MPNNNEINKKALIGDIMLKITKIAEQDNKDELIKKIADVLESFSKIEEKEKIEKLEGYFDKIIEATKESYTEELPEEINKGKDNHLKEPNKIDENNSNNVVSNKAKKEEVFLKDKPEIFFKPCNWMTNCYFDETSNYQTSLSDAEIGALNKDITHGMIYKYNTKLIKNNSFIYKNKDGLFILGYQPDQFRKREYNRYLSRSFARYHTLVVLLSLEELERIQINDETVYYLDNDENCADELERLQRKYGNNKLAHKSDLPKIKVPFSNKKREFKEDDIIFFECLSNFIKTFKDSFYQKYRMDNLLNNSTTININFLNNNKLLQLEDIINLSILFDKSDVDIQIFPSDKNRLLSPITNYTKSVNSVTINSTNEIEFGYGRTLNIDIKDGFSTKDNIEKLYYYIINNNYTVKNLKGKEEYNTRLEQYYESIQPTLEKLEELYYNKFGEKLNNESNGRRR